MELLEIVLLLAPSDDAAEEDERMLDAVRVQVLQRPVEMLRNRLAEGDALAGVVLRARHEIPAHSAPDVGPLRPPAACDVRAHVRELEEEALQAELEAITDLRERGAITRSQASALRDEIYVIQMSLVEEE